MPGDFGATLAGVEAVGIGPHATQQRLHLLFAQIGQIDAVAARVGEGQVGLAATGELAVKLNAVADIDDDEERRPAFKCPI